MSKGNSSLPKKVMVSIIALCLLVTSAVFVSARSTPDSVTLKNELIKKAPKVTITTEKEKDLFAQKVSAEFKDVFSKYGYNQAEFDKFFADNGYIKFDMKRATTSGIDSLLSFLTTDSYASSAGSVTMSTPSIYYNTYSGRWTAVGGGYWDAAMSWQFDRKSNILGYYNGNMGGADAFGLYFSNLKTSSGTQAAVLRQELYIRPLNGSNVMVSTSRMNSATDNGVFFQYQDLTYNDGNITNYNCDGFAVLLEFNSTFADVHGVVSSGLEHNWENTGIASYTISNSGWSITPSGDVSKSWPAYSVNATY